MKVLHVIQHLHKLSGVSVYCAELCEALADAGVECCVAVQNMGDTNRIPSSRVPRRQLSEVVAEKGDWDVVHIHNLWTPVLHQGATFARKFGGPIVWSLHGTLSPWAFNYKRWKKFLPWHLYQKNDLLRAAVHHVTSDNEEEWVKGFGLKRPIVNIPMGASLPSGNNVHDRQDNHSGTLLFVGRIAPVKSLPKLIEAFALVRPKDWKLRIVGVEDFAGYTDSLLSKVKELGVGDVVEFPGQKFGEDLQNEYRAAAALALVSETENFGAVVADAMAYSLPVITTRGTPWSITETSGAGWWVDNTVEAIADSIKELTSLSDAERLAMGERGRAVVESHYSWEAIAARMNSVYASLLAKA